MWDAAYILLTHGSCISVIWKCTKRVASFPGSPPSTCVWPLTVQESKNPQFLSHEQVCTWDSRGGTFEGEGGIAPDTSFTCCASFLMVAPPFVSFQWPCSVIISVYACERYYFRNVDNIFLWSGFSCTLVKWNKIDKGFFHVVANSSRI